MSVTINESDMSFGEFAIEDIFEIEKTLDSINFGKHIRKVEFIVRLDNGKKPAIAFIEAKSSIPKKTDEFFSEIQLKIQHSLIIWFTTVNGRHDKLTNFLPINLNSPAHLKLPIKIFLVIPITVPNSNLSVLTHKLRASLKSEKNIWNIKDENIFVLNQSKAIQYGLSTN